MNTIRKLILGVAALTAALSFLPLPAAYAAQQNMCSPVAVATQQNRRVTNPATGGGSYNLNSRGCAMMAPADVAYFLSQGFVKGEQIFSLVANALTAAGTVTLPAGAYIDRIIVQSVSAGAVTGGMKIGTTSGASDVVGAAICGANCLIWVPDASIATRIFASTSPQTLFIDAVTAFAGVSVTVTVMYGLY